MTPLYMHYTPCFGLVEHAVCHEPISFLINIYIYTLYLVFIYTCIILYESSILDTFENFVL